MREVDSGAKIMESTKEKMNKNTENVRRKRHGARLFDGTGGIPEKGPGKT